MWPNLFLENNPHKSLESWFYSRASSKSPWSGVNQVVFTGKSLRVLWSFYILIMTFIISKKFSRVDPLFSRWCLSFCIWKSAHFLHLQKLKFASQRDMILMPFFLLETKYFFQEPFFLPPFSQNILVAKDVDLNIGTSEVLWQLMDSSFGWDKTSFPYSWIELRRVEVRTMTQKFVYVIFIVFFLGGIKFLHLFWQLKL